MAGLLAVYLFVAWAKGLHLFSVASKTYYIDFQNVSGLKIGDPVNVSGYHVGNVKEIELIESGARVKVTVSEKVQVKENASAQILIKELMGGKMIELSPGSQGAVLASNEQISGETSMDFSTAFVKFGDLFDNLNPASIDSLLINMNELAANFNEIGGAMSADRVEKMFINLEGASQNLNDILAKVEQKDMIEDMDSAIYKFTALADNASGTLDRLDKIAMKIEDKTLPSTDSLIVSATGMMEEAEKMIVSANELLAQLQNEKTPAGRLLYDEELALKMDSTLANLNKTLDHLRRKKIHVSMSLSGKPKEYEE